MRKFYPIIGCILYLVLGFILVRTAGHDDTHITFWESYSINHFHEIWNFNGERVEVSSSLFFAILIAIFQTITHLSYVDVGYLLSILFGATAVLLFPYLIKINGETKYEMSLILGLVPCYFYWGFGGMETTLVSLLFILVYYFAIRYIWDKKYLFWFVFANLLFQLSRPETGIVAIAVFLSAIIVEWIRKRKEVISQLVVLFIYSVLIFIVIGLARLSYFGQWFPQPTYAKTGGYWLIKLSYGFDYFKSFTFRFEYVLYGLLLIISLWIFFMKMKEIKIDFTLLFLFVFGYIGFVTVTGGDWMGGWRFYVHILPLLIALALCSIDYLTQSRKWIAIISFLLLLSNVYGITQINHYQSGKVASTEDSIDKKIKDAGYDPNKYSVFEKMNRIHAKDIPMTEELIKTVEELKPHLKKKVVIMSIQAGFIEYYLNQKHYGDTEFIDTVGLTTKDMTDCELTKNGYTSYYGILLGYENILKNYPKYIKTCDFKQPDIIFDMKPNHKPGILEKYGYTIVYLQTGDIHYKNNNYIGRKVVADELIAVRTELLPYLKDESKVWKWNWNE